MDSARLLDGLADMLLERSEAQLLRLDVTVLTIMPGCVAAVGERAAVRQFDDMFFRIKSASCTTKAVNCMYHPLKARRQLHHIVHSE